MLANCAGWALFGWHDGQSRTAGYMDGRIEVVKVRLALIYIFILDESGESDLKSAV